VPKCLVLGSGEQVLKELVALQIIHQATVAEELPNQFFVLAYTVLTDTMRVLRRNRDLGFETGCRNKEWIHSASIAR
jgi:hypothetical protein